MRNGHRASPVAVSFVWASRPGLKLASARLLEGADCGGLVVPDVEDGVELGDLEEVVDLLGEVEKLEFAAGIFDRGEGADELADARAVDVADVFQVEQDVL